MDHIFNNTAVAFAHKTTKELRRARILFLLLSKMYVVRIGLSLLQWSKRMRIQGFWFIERIIYRHFCAGANLMQTSAVVRQEKEDKNFTIESGSFETLVHLSNEGMGITLLPYLHSKNMSKDDQKNLRNFVAPAPARAISMIYHENKLKLHIIDALHQLINGIVRAAIAFEDIKIVSPKNTSVR